MKKNDFNIKMLDPENCAMCGMCTNYCPTYKISKNESESPRGRISIIEGLNKGELKPTASALKHLNSCTMCLACESICPAEVNFYDLMVQARDKYFHKQKLIFKIKSLLLSIFFTKNVFRIFIKKIFNILIKVRLDKAKIGIFKNLQYIKTNTKKRINFKTYDTNRKNIGIFTGCATDIFQESVSRDCIDILNRNNINAEILKNTKCCGSLDFHNGRKTIGLKNYHDTISKFNTNRYKKIIGYASGCSAFLMSNKNYEDATSYILNILTRSNANFKTSYLKVCIHKPCTTRLANINFENLIQILKMVPELSVSIFDDKYCCGAGAQNLLHNKNNSLEIINPKISFLDKNNIDIILTYNVGCSLNFINAINTNNLENVKVMHPISFLNDRLI